MTSRVPLVSFHATMLRESPQDPAPRHLQRLDLTSLEF